jgi:hypothetical protein
MKKLLVLLLPFVLAACATAPPPKIDVPEINKSQSVVMHDARPAAEQQSEIFSLLITSERYGTIRMAEIKTEPSPLRLFQHRVFERLGDKGPLDVTVHHLVVYMNQQGQLRAGALGGLVGLAIVSGREVSGSSTVVDSAVFEGMKGDDEFKRALFTKAENPQNAPVLIVYIDATINGKRITTKTVSPLKQPEGKVPYVVALESASTFFLSQY